MPHGYMGMHYYSPVFTIAISLTTSSILFDNIILIMNMLVVNSEHRIFDDRIQDQAQRWCVTLWMCGVLLLFASIVRIVESGFTMGMGMHFCTT